VSETRRVILEALRRVLTGPLGLPADSPLLDDALALETPRETSQGDLTGVAAMRLSKALRKNPREIARTIVDALAASGALADVVEPPTVAGPGFINFTLKKSWVESERSRFHRDADARLGVEPALKPRTVVVDFSAPNVAKPMHVGHIRSTVIGDSISRVLKLLGHRVIRDNHLGDWGTQFGMIIHGLKSGGLAERAGSMGTDEIEKIYRSVNDRIEAEGDAGATAQAARAEVVKLHSGDPENRDVWQALMRASLPELDATYARLGVSFDVTLGESFYDPMLPSVVADLKTKGLARESEGALAIFYEGEKLPPFLVQKRDGAFLYAATDLATVKYRVDTWRADWMIYVVDGRQQLHFNQLFEAARMWGYSRVRFEHPWFGSVLGEDGKPFRTRAGGTVRLSELLDEAESRATAVVEAKSPELSADEKRNIARVVGIGALKYADLSQNRTSDYVFSWDKMLALQGNTAPYMQYMYARIRSIFRKSGLDGAEFDRAQAACRLDAPEELALAKALIAFPDAVELAGEQLRPNFLSAYLYDLAGRFSAFYDHCPVLQAPDEATRRSRLSLCDHTARVIKLGLDLLGIDVVEQM
jgi:arginyl-tRNA synthetase